MSQLKRFRVKRFVEYSSPKYKHTPTQHPTTNGFFVFDGHYTLLVSSIKPSNIYMYICPLSQTSPSTIQELSCTFTTVHIKQQHNLYWKYGNLQLYYSLPEPPHELLILTATILTAKLNRRRSNNYANPA